MALMIIHDVNILFGAVLLCAYNTMRAVTICSSFSSLKNISLGLKEKYYLCGSCSKKGECIL